MAFTQQLHYETIRTVDTSTLSGSYVALGTPLAHPASIVKLVNASNISLAVSVDGVNQHDIAPATSFFLYDVTTNTPSQGDNAIFIPQGTQYYVNGSDGTGDVYLVVQYIVQI
jgi:hypothetical protein